jgi:cytochrome c oxidase subunit I+III
VLLFLLNVLWARRLGLAAAENPWGADTLEWSTLSPPPTYNYARLPTVQSRYALWTQTEHSPAIVGLSTENREALVTSILDAEPEHRYELPGPSIWPLMLSLAVAAGLIPGIFTPWAFPIAGGLAFFALFGWFWSDPNSQNRSVKRERKRTLAAERPQPLRMKEA